jgi:hypothetical protein
MHIEKSKNSTMGKVFSCFCECKKRKNQTVNFKTQVKEPRNIPSQVPLKEPGYVNQPGRISGRGLAKGLRPLYTPRLKKKFQKPLVTPPTHHQFLHTCPSLGLRKTWTQPAL